MWMLGFVPGKRRCTTIHCDIHPTGSPWTLGPKDPRESPWAPAIQPCQPSYCSCKLLYVSNQGAGQLQVVASRGGEALHVHDVPQYHSIPSKPSQGMYFLYSASF